MKILKWVGLTVVVIAVVLTWTARTHTAPFIDQQGKQITGSIAEQRFMSVNGDQHYVLLRGRDRKAPILLYLHGGPGFTGMPFVRHHNSDLENHFVMVHWDQRATGKSFKPGTDPNSLNLELYVEDLDDLVNQLRIEFSQDKVNLVGHSWGSMLGLAYIKKHPEKVSAYFGIGQAGSQPVSEAENYLWAQAQAEKRDDQESLNVLQEVGPPPYASAKDMMRERSVANKYGGGWVSPKSTQDFAMALMRVDEFSWFDLINVLRSETFSLQPLFRAMSDFDAYQNYSELGVPVVLLTGRHDRIISSLESHRFFESLNAPYKAFEWFENSAHNPHSEQPEEFNQRLLLHAKKIGVIN